MNKNIKTFDNCLALDGYHCQTNSLAKIFHYFGHPLSENMIFGLGAGIGFIYWQMKFGEENSIFVGGRGNNKGFFSDLASRTGIEIKQIFTSSMKKAESSLLRKLSEKEPVMMFGDMSYLPWFNFPIEYHFGGHTFVVCGYDGKEGLLASDMDSGAAGLKKGFFHEITLEQLATARNSPYKPFPPKNSYFEFDFENFHNPTKKDIESAIKQVVGSQLNPPIKNAGIKGIRHTANEILKWPAMFDETDLIMNLFNLYIFFEIGGTGGGCFRYMYSRFLKEAMEITGNELLGEAAVLLNGSGEKFTEIGLIFKDVQTMEGINEKIENASEIFHEIAAIEEKTYQLLSK